MLTQLGAARVELESPTLAHEIEEAKQVFNPLLRMPSGVNWSFFGSFNFGNPGFPLSDVPLQDIAAQVAAGQLEAAPSRVFSFDEIHEAHRTMEAGGSGGKMVDIIE